MTHSTVTPQRANQRQLEELLEEAQRQPGVAEAAEVYARLLPHVPSQVASTNTAIRFATGGNE